MDIYNSNGWSNRRRLAQLKNSDFYSEERVAIRRERQAGYDEEAAANEAAKAARDAALVESQCQCVACGGSGRTTVTKAAGIIEAMHNYGFQSYKPSRQMVIALDAIAKGEPQPPGTPVISFTYGSINPSPGVAPVLPATESDPVAVETPRPARAKKSELPESRNVEAVTHDGFLIET